MLYRLSLFLFTVALIALALGVWNVNGIRLSSAQTVFHTLLTLSALSLVTELAWPVKARKKKPEHMDGRVR